MVVRLIKSTYLIQHVESDLEPGMKDILCYELFVFSLAFTGKSSPTAR